MGTTVTKQTGRKYRVRGAGLGDPHTEISDVEMQIEVDWSALAEYFADKLAYSKGGVSRIQGGAILARRINVTRRRA